MAFWKKRFLFGMAVVSLLSSCSNSLDVVAPAESVPVVYFRLNPADSLYFLTLTKTFSGISSVYDLARDPDRVFFETASIRLEGWANTYKIWETRFELSDRSKNPGIFPPDPGYCFESPNEFFPQDKSGNLGSGYDQITSFRLVLDVNDSDGPVVSTLAVVPYPRRIFPGTPLKVLDLFPDGISYKAGIQVDPEHVKYCDLICAFRYQTYQGDRLPWENHEVNILLRKNIQIIDNKAITYIDPDLFFAKVALSIQPVNDTIIRKFLSLDLIFLAGDGHFADYNSTYVNAGNLDSPPVGNISHGIGLFTMVRSVSIEKDMIMSYRMLENLSTGELTRKLGFVRW